MNNYVVSLIRTYVPSWVAGGLVWLAVHFGVILDDNLSLNAGIIATGIVVAVYYAAVRAAELRWPSVGRLLLGLGATGSPEYGQTVRAVR